jgi:regulator of cell morphogenesis and NO signaling
VRELSDKLLPHLDDEERDLFPHMLAEPLDAPLVRRELASMREEHLVVGELLERLRGATDDYRRPEWACNSYGTLFTELEQLETDVLVHVHLENHELLPRFTA